FDEPGHIRIVTVHHHLVGIPGTGRERNIVLDAADVLLTLTDLDIDLVLSGHKHVPFFWVVNGLLICNSGTAVTRRVRAGAPSSRPMTQYSAQGEICITPCCRRRKG